MDESIILFGRFACLAHASKEKPPSRAHAHADPPLIATELANDQGGRTCWCVEPTLTFRFLKPGRAQALLATGVLVFHRRPFRGMLSRSSRGLPSAGTVGEPVAVGNILPGRKEALSRRTYRIGDVTDRLES